MSDQEAGAGFLINGAEYAIPDVNTFSLDEDLLLWEYADLAREDFVRVDPELDDAEALEAARRQRLKHPGLMRTLLHVAYQRGNPDVKPSEVKKLIGAVRISEAMSRLVAEEPEADDSPPDGSVTTQPHSESLSNGSSVTDDTTKQSHESSGDGSETFSDRPALHRVSSGTG